MPSFQRSVAVLLLPLHKFRKNSVSAVRITLLVSTIPLRRCCFHLPLCRNCRNCRSVANRIESYFCRSAVGGQPITVLVTSNAVNGKTFPAIPFSRATATAATERQNGTLETRHKMWSVRAAGNWMLWSLCVLCVGTCSRKDIIWFTK